MPIAIAANAIPIIAFAPIFNAWFDPLSPALEDGDRGRPLLLPGDGQHAARADVRAPAQIELMRSYAAGELEIFRRVRVPTALPFVFTGLKIATRPRDDRRDRRRVLRRLDERARRLIQNSTSQLFDFETAWAAILVACTFGIALYVAVAAAERRRPLGAGSDA